MSFAWWALFSGRRIGRKRRNAATIHNPQLRRLQCEALEERRLLSVTVAPITTGTNNSNSFTVPSGMDLYVPITGSDPGQTITYSVNSGSLPGIVATVMPSSNPTLTLDVSGTKGDGTSFSGAMTFQLFENLAQNTVENIINLVDSGEYTNNLAEFYRILTSAPEQLIQGGILYSGSSASAPPSISDEYNSALTYNSPGLLAMATAGPNTGSSDFFITAPGIDFGSEPNSNLNFQYSIFGQLTGGFDIYNDILNTQLVANPTTGEHSSPAKPITITGASIGSDTQNGVVQISEPSDFNGTTTITVTANASDGTTTQQTFSVTAEQPSASLVSAADPLVLNDPFPYGSSTTPTTAENTADSLPLEADVLPELTGGTYTFSVLPITKTFGDAPLVSSTGISNVSASITPGPGNTATLTLTPSGNFTGTLNLLAEVDYTVTVNSQTVTLRDDLPISLTVAPTAPNAVLASPLAGIEPADAGDTTTTIDVDYSDNGANLDTTTLGTGNITVSNGSTQAPVVGFQVLSGGEVAYTVQSPGANWGSSPQGEYTVSLVAGSVKDVNGNGVVAATLGQFLADTNLPLWVSFNGMQLNIASQSSSDTLNLAFADATDFVITLNGQSQLFSTSQFNAVTYSVSTQNAAKVVVSGDGTTENATFGSDYSATLSLYSGFDFNETGAAAVYCHHDGSKTLAFRRIL